MSPPPEHHLREQDSATGRLLEGARDATERGEPGRKERVWRQLSQVPRRSPVRWLVTVTLAVAAAASLVLVLFVSRGPLAFVTLTAGEVQASVAEGSWAPAQVPQPLARGAGLRTGEQGRTWLRLPSAGVLLLEGGVVRLPSGSELTLEQGAVVVATKPPGRVVVVAGAFRVEATDALFTVRYAAAHTGAFEVLVEEGTVSVRGPGPERSLPAGAWWTADGKAPSTASGNLLALARGQLATAREETPLSIDGLEGASLSVDGLDVGVAPVRLLTRAGAHVVIARHQGQSVEATVGVALEHHTLPSAAELESVSYEKARRLSLEGRHGEAVAIYEALSEGKSTRAEAALYEAGRLRQRFLKDPEGALESFSAHAQRFPQGALAQEAALSAIEARLQLAQLEPALGAMEAFLARYPRSERLDDVRFLQAQVHAQRGDCAMALRLFGGLLGDTQHVHGDDALYLTAYCEQALHQNTQARRHLEQYLERFPNGKHRAEAKAALKKQ